ncbi:hypothetical protein N7520_009823 [Penicillium odoratum]|uniref:uncharacterized protein n=1 Tax=Penicillium odoratum TaxID=1167516 RepID=UPI002549B197|nr:uncharacterized protein N7520_009823 [Penicillium odoratum]KAJ5752906.1 hypothetical protein N7520_009823 [Penicillium odoratum]
MTVPPPAGEVLLIPKTFSSPRNLDEVADRYKNLRLHGLLVDPKSFSSTYETESQFSPATWRARLQNPAGNTFVSVINPETKCGVGSDTVSSPPEDSDTLQRLLGKDWVGIVTLLGPVLLSKPNAEKETIPAKPWDVFLKDGVYNIPHSSPSGDITDSNVVYLVVAMFVLPEARRRGHAYRLLETLIQTVRDDAHARGVSQASITIQVEPENDTAQRLYEKLGFEVWDKAVPIQNKRGETSQAISLVMEIDI